MDFYEIQVYLIEQLSAHNDTSKLLTDFLAYIKTNENEATIAKIEKLDFNTDIISIESQLTETLKTEPPKIKVKGYWFGIFEAEEDSNHIFQGYISGNSKASATDEDNEWAVDPKYFPESRYFKSTVLEKLPQILLNESDDFSTQYFPLWYLTIVIANYCKKINDLLLNSDKCLIAVGWDSGDFINVGHLSKKGFELLKFKIRKPKELKKTKTNHRYYGINATWSNAWILDIINDSDLVSGFAVLGKPIDLHRKYEAQGKVGINCYPIDYNEALGTPIISQKLLDLLLPYNNNGEFEYVPILINNDPNLKYYILNILKSNKCLNNKETVWMTEDYADDFVFTESEVKHKTLFRLKSKDIHEYIYVNAEIKEILESNRITGINLVPIRTV